MTTSNLTYIISSFALSSILSLFLTPIMILIAKKFDIVDKPNYRKMHKTSTPLLGGLAIYIAFIVTVAIFSFHQYPLVKIAVILGATLIEIVAIIDDIKNLSPKLRIVIMFLLSVAIYLTFYYSYFTWNILHDNLWMKILLCGVVVFWVTGIINAINFTDGIDGLSSYFSLIALFAFSVILAIQGRYEFALIVNIAAIGGVIGFIPYNRHKALIFMGDAGSMLLGFIIGMISLVSTTKADTVLYVIVPVYILLIPLLELITSIMRRLILKKPIFLADKYHFHHLLSRKIDDNLIVVVLLASVQVLFAFLGVIIYIYGIYIIGLVLLIAVTIAILALLTYKYIKLREELAECADDSTKSEA
ncbi:MAG: MraY family glycosyltransferase [Eubacteriales bacterium]